MKRLLHRVVNFPPVQSFLKKNRLVVKAFFEMTYRKPDPYKAKSLSELAKFDHTFAVLNGSRYGMGLEIGCGEGVNTWRIAQRCKGVLAVDISGRAIKRAKLNQVGGNANFEVMDIVKDNLDRVFDYIFIAETLYYIHIDQLNEVIEKIVKLLAYEGTLHVMHSRTIHDDESGLPLKEFGAKTIHGRLIRHPKLAKIIDEPKEMYRVTVLRKVMR